jgi:hypothetical protein
VGRWETELLLFVGQKNLSTDLSSLNVIYNYKYNLYSEYVSGVDLFVIECREAQLILYWG